MIEVIQRKFTKATKLSVCLFLFLGLIAATAPQEDADIIYPIFTLLALTIVLTVYFIPAIIAAKRDHVFRGSITVLNLLAGWSVLGWVASLIWALYPLPEQKNANIGNKNIASELENLARLRDKGILTEQEFADRKATLLYNS